MFQTFQDSAGGWRWRSKAANAEIDAQSEAYTTETDAERGARDHVANVLTDIIIALAANQATLASAHPPPVRVGCDAMRSALSALAASVGDLPIFSKE